MDTIPSIDNVATICFLSELSLKTILLILSAIDHERHWGIVVPKDAHEEAMIEAYMHWLIEDVRIRILAPKE